MKKSILFLIVLFCTSNLFGGFHAVNIFTSNSWWYTEIEKFETKIELYGLFYETTVNLKLKLGKEYHWNYGCQKPPAGNYEFIWDFNLTKESYIKDFQVWDNQKEKFVRAGIIDLSTAEADYNSNVTNSVNGLLRQYMRRDYNGSYNLQYDMRIKPVGSEEYVEIIIQYITPCKMQFNKRLVNDNSYQFYSNYSNYGNCNKYANPKIRVIDYNNPDTAPKNFQNINTQWTKAGTFWETEISLNNNYYYNNFILEFAPESDNGKFLKTYTNAGNKFYQLATLPHITDELRYPRNIIIACDLINESLNGYTRDNFLEMLKQPLKISTTEKDSLAFVMSDFNVTFLDTKFLPSTDELIDIRINDIKQTAPKLNTLPYMLKEIIQFLNEQNRDAEVWIVSNDYQTAQRAETVMELLQQTYFKAENKVVFKIVDAGSSYRSYWIQNTNYRGNGYLYQNLSRLSGGNFEYLYDLYTWSIIDKVIDCWAPTVTTVEIDPVPNSGVSFSRVNLNGGNNNFDITDRYFQYGVYEGDGPFEVKFYGNYLGGSYFNNIGLSEDEKDITFNMAQNTELYWYGNYIMNDLFLQPQSYSTIKYIEELSVVNNLITPYSGFVIPGPNGYRGFKRIFLADSTEDNNKPQSDDPILPENISIAAYPNPFNPSTTINIEFNEASLKGEKKLEIFNILGQKVKSYNITEINNSGMFNVVWNGLNDSGTAVASGTYIVLLKTSTVAKSIKLLLVR